METVNGVMQIRNHLLEELELSVRTSCNLIRSIKPEEWEYQPQDNMRTLLQLVHHLVSIPASDLAIMQEQPQPEIELVENDASSITHPEELAQRFESNFDKLRTYMVSLSEDDFLNKSTKAFYADHGMVQVKWLIEVVTHTFHHRSQLYNYLKQQGHELHFSMLYA
ncbi:DinB family protein [Paenibacillus pini]|uniref:DinB-like domain-containing protein n=1 Tax=Paenibacillus pini JCM 16418 TaxID=1236976 RepID=W7YSL1_9BACL|nr:DinB family protein [Paenibacillus pini]GAF07616.1 hypothetical protein JCM16418_1643 [Paenibacillus pini JCM 16418]